MNEKYSRTVDELLNMFSDSLTPADVLSSKLMAQVSSAITNERLRLQMSQQEFAEYIGVPQSLISRWEHGDYNFSIRKISEIMAKLNLDVNFFIDPMETEYPVKTSLFSRTYSNKSDRINILLFPKGITGQEMM